MSEQIIIYTDGSALGNPGPGGYGIVMKYREMRKELSRGYRRTTNNRMELLAVIEAIRALNDKAQDKEIIVITDSKYVMNAVELKWLYQWQKKNFKGKANADLWRKFLAIYPQYSIRFEWVKGHSGDPDNERCDILAKQAAKSDKLIPDEGYESNSDNSSGKLFE